jgi:hypothetical protein
MHPTGETVENTIEPIPPLREMETRCTSVLGIPLKLQKSTKLWNRTKAVRRYDEHQPRKKDADKRGRSKRRRPFKVSETTMFGVAQQITVKANFSWEDGKGQEINLKSETPKWRWYTVEVLHGCSNDG